MTRVRVLAFAFAFAALSLLLAGPVSSAPSFTTEAEKSGFKRTGRYDEVVRLCSDFQTANPGQVKCITFGKTPEGRPMVALVVSADGAFTPDDMRAKKRDALVIQGGIHAGEIEGKDAIFIALRELLAGKMAPGVLGKVTVVFVPIFNIDGAERFGPHNRPNQRGPEEMGFRANAQNLNLNRDYVKAETPEMQAMLGLLDAWDPIVYVDLHTTDGAKFQPDVSILVAPDAPQAGLEKSAQELSAAFMTRLAAMKHLPLAFYPDFRLRDDPKSGFASSQAPPRFSQEYAATRNRLGVLVETHSWKTYGQRVAATHDTLQVLFEQTITQQGAWRAAATSADRAAEKLGGTDVNLVSIAGPTPRPIDFLGYAYTVTPSEISGKGWIVYDETKPQVWHVPLFDQPVPSLTVHAPRAGYLVSVAHAAWLEPLLKLHEIRYQVVGRPLDRAVQGFHVNEVTYEPPFEGRTQAKLKGDWRATKQSFPAGSLYIPLAQPHALLAMHLLEPEAPDSLVAWGRWNAMFEQKEYMEEYVLEGEARRMLAADPKLKAEFDKRVHDDADFAKSPEKRLRFFYVRHPAWDERIGWVPVFRTDEPR